MSYKTFEIINGELFINEPCTKQYKEYSEAMAVIEDDEAMANQDVIEGYYGAQDEPEYGSDLIDIGLDD